MVWNDNNVCIHYRLATERKADQKQSIFSRNQAMTDSVGGRYRVTVKPLRVQRVTPLQMFGKYEQHAA